MVPPTEQEDRETGFTPIDPMDHVMSITPVMGTTTTGVGASLVPQDQRTPDRSRHNSGRPPDV